MGSKAIELTSIPHLLALYSKPFNPKSAWDWAALLMIAVFSTIYLSHGIVWDRPDPHHYIWYKKPQESESLETRPKATRNIAQKLEEAGKNCVVFWGSQSGTGERFAKRLTKELQLRFSLGSIAIDLSDYDPETLSLLSTTQVAVFILSTYGEGDPSDNTTAFYEYLIKHDATLHNLRYAAFGLGSSNYQHYNRVVDVVVERLCRAGAQRIATTGKANDATGTTEEDFMAWKDGLCNALQSYLGLNEQAMCYQPNISALLDESLDLVDLHMGDPAALQSQGKQSSKSSAIKHLNILNTHELFKGGTRNCLHMELDLAEQNIKYKTGDHLGVWPKNSEQEVQLLLEALGRSGSGDVPVLLRRLDPEVSIKVPTPATLNTLFRSYLEICAPVSRDVLAGLVQFAPTADAKTFISNLAQDRQCYQDLISHTQTTLGRVLGLASPGVPWSDLPLAWVIENISTIQPRYYSISSSSVLSPHRIAVTALISAETLPKIKTGTEACTIHGVTTNYMRALAQKLPHDTETHTSAVIPYHVPADKQPRIYAHVRRSKFKLPLNKATPIIMVAAGTGLAPFRAFIAERAKVAASVPTGAMWLIFGCRAPDQDYIYREELESIQNNLQSLQSSGGLKIVTAFSRSQEVSPKTYVQDRVTEHASELLDLLSEQGASFYICGRSAMARAVGSRMVDAVRKHRDWDQAAASGWLDTLKRQGKWREDVWG